MPIKSYQFKSLLFSFFLIFFFFSKGFALDMAGTEYVVKEGDTLWGISSSHYTDPFLWPKLWGKNHSIPHPDKIYPGEKIFLPSEEVLKEIEKKEEPAREVSVPKEDMEPVASEESKTGQEEEIKKEEGTDISQFEPVSENETKKSPSWTLSDLVTGGFILKDVSGEKRLGQIVASENEHLLLGEGDVVYIVPEESHIFKVGERYTIYEPVKSVHHPKTRRLMGKLIRIKGMVEIIPNSMASAKDTYSARIIKSYELIGLKDLLTDYRPVDPIDVVINEVPFPKKLKGLVVASKDAKENNGEHDIVYLDKGRQDGVEPGTLLVVFKEGKKAQFYSPSGIESLPRRIVADLEVISAEKETSTAIVARSIEPVVVGDQISNPPLSR